MTARQPAKAAADPGTFDLSAARAARSEAAGAPFPFLFAGKAYTIPPTKEWPLAAMDSLAEGNVGEAMRVLLGPDQYKSIAADGGTLGDVETLFGALSAASGLTPGE